MAEIVPYNDVKEAYEVIKKNLSEMGYDVDDFKEIAYGIQFLISLKDKTGLLRIFKGKEGTRLDTSQIKEPQFVDDIFLSLGIYNELKFNKEDLETGRVYSLCVGINNFGDATLSQLSYADKDASVLHDILVEKFGAEGNIQLINEQATYKNIIEAIIRIKEITKKEDTVLISFSTHGQFDKYDFFLIASDSNTEKLNESALPMQKLKELVSQIPAEKKVLFLDCCHSGGICKKDGKEMPTPLKDKIFENFSSEEFVIITSSLANELSQEFDELRHGVFTFYLINGLTGAIETSNDEIDIYTLFLYINKYVDGYVERKKNPKQTPRLFANIKGKFNLPKLKRPKGFVSAEKIFGEDSKFNFETINCVGIDESGKGDYFGPLVVASVYVNTKEKMVLLKNLGVKDCKKVPDSRVKILSKQIKQLCDHEIIAISPQTYNNMYSNMGNLNILLAWAHAQALEKVLIRNPNCDTAISDQFAAKDVLIEKLKEKGKQIQLIQRPKAEENMAVAAASILARAKFIESLEELSNRYKQTFSKGINDSVIKEAINFIKTHKDIEKVAKTHFKTHKKILEELNKSS